METPINIIPYIMITTEGTINTSIRTSKILLIMGLGGVFEIFYMLSPKRKEVPIRNETTVRRFRVAEFTIELRSSL
jgi:hypothetical protein